MAKEKDRHQDEKDMEHRRHNRYEGIGFPQGSVKGGKTKRDPFPCRFLFPFYVHRGIGPFLFLGQFEKLEELEYQPQDKYDKSD
jgi:hypothetical protein